jgi:hypothetical protein
MAGGARKRARCISELILAEAQRRQGGDVQKRVQVLEEQMALLLQTSRP